MDVTLNSILTKEQQFTLDSYARSLDVETEEILDTMSDDERREYIIKWKDFVGEYRTHAMLARLDS